MKLLASLRKLENSLQKESLADVKPQIPIRTVGIAKIHGMMMPLKTR